MKFIGKIKIQLLLALTPQKFSIGLKYEVEKNQEFISTLTGGTAMLQIWYNQYYVI